MLYKSNFAENSSRKSLPNVFCLLNNKRLNNKITHLRNFLVETIDILFRVTTKFRLLVLSWENSENRLQ